MDLSVYEGVVFDMDGTLVDSMPDHLEAWRVACEAFGLTYDRAYIHRNSGIPSLTIAKMIAEMDGVTVDPHQVAQAKSQAWQEIGTVPDLIPKTYALFEEYYGKLPLAVGTGSSRSSAEKILRDVGIRDRLSALVTSSDVQRGKPCGETFEKAACLMGVDPKKCVVFEDTLIGVRAAADAGMDCYLLSDDGFQFFRH